MTKNNRANEQAVTRKGDTPDPVAQALEKLRLAVKEIVKGATAGGVEAS